jgi:hypothetical protein
LKRLIDVANSWNGTASHGRLAAYFKSKPSPGAAVTQKPKVHHPKAKFLLTRKFPDWEETNESYENARNSIERRALESEIAKIDAYAEGLNVIPGHVLDVGA